MHFHANRTYFSRLISAASIVLALSIPYATAYASLHDEKVDPYRAMRNYEGALVNKPVYDPTSKSYFELVEVEGGLSYKRALSYARSKSYGGVRGRLAIIRSPQTQRFLNNIFRPESEAWIGLRLYCPRRVLFWTDGRTLNRAKDYANWGPNWHYAKNYIPCKPGDKIAGVTLAPVESAGYAGRGLRWFAIAPRHAVAYSIIEYPTGGK